MHVPVCTPRRSAAHAQASSCALGSYETRSCQLGCGCMAGTKAVCRRQFVRGSFFVCFFLFIARELLLLSVSMAMCPCVPCVCVCARYREKSSFPRGDGLLCVY